MTPPLTPAGAAAATAADMAALVQALSAANGNRSAAAKTLAISRRTLDRRVSTLGLTAWLAKTYPLSVRQPLRANSDRRREQAKRKATLARKAAK